jgi:hypothetical protein
MVLKRNQNKVNYKRFRFSPYGKKMLENKVKMMIKEEK